MPKEARPEADVASVLRKGGNTPPSRLPFSPLEM